MHSQLNVSGSRQLAYGWVGKRPGIVCFPRIVQLAPKFRLRAALTLIDGEIFAQHS
jgi:hypothetical protein